ncbi:MAG: YifB family Mg chelatase-like AAA ATPase [bacterium]
MLSKVLSATTYGLDARLIEVEVDFVSSQLPGLLIVGMAEKSIQEAKERVLSAAKNIGFVFPSKKIIVNMAPAEMPKTGALFDLSIAVGILATGGYVTVDKEAIFIGELALDGGLRSINGSIAIADMCRKVGIKRLFLPMQNAAEAALVPEVQVFGVQNLNDLLEHLNGNVLIPEYKITLEDYLTDDNFKYENDFAHIKGQAFAKRACEIAAAGGHNILMAGSPGSGKTLIARTLPSILPRMTFEESLDITRIYSISGQLPSETPLMTRRPFRSPHHTSSTVALIGGGKIPRPGEVSLAHRGILFLDEFPEFTIQALEALRQPLEDQKVTVSRISGTITYPANFMLVAAMNPCRCGWKGDKVKKCICTQAQIQMYQKKISGPIMDRIDLQINVARVEINELTQKTELAESSVSIAERVQKARDIQNERYIDSVVISNSDIKQKDMEKYCFLEEEAENLLKSAANKMMLSARSYFRIIKVSRTIADLEGSKDIKKIHIAEALQYRIMEGDIGEV